MSVPLRDYQADAVQAARHAIRGGAKNVLICAPTGAGKTQIAAHLIEESRRKGRRSAFVVDRLSLVHQTSETFDRHGIEHGVIQAEHARFRPSLPVQLCSVGTLSRRRWPEADLIVVDEAHVLSQTVKNRIMPRDTIVLGLTATPFTKGLGRFFDAIINVTTTNRLIEQGWLSKYRIFACVEPDMAGVPVVAGEFAPSETEKRALQIVGDVVGEYVRRGENRKFICSAVDTAHVEELQRQFVAAGVNAATYTYKDRDEDRVETVDEFRKPASSIRGLITVTAASRGFDVPDIGCVIIARPLRRSLAEHIQFLGRGLRIADDKPDCLVLDHAGNCTRMWHEMQQFFEHGVSSLDDGSVKPKKPPEKNAEAELLKCPECSALHRLMPSCPSCGFEYPRRSNVQHVPGTLRELVATADARLLRENLWPMVCGFVLEERRPRDMEHAQRMAQAIYFELTGGPAKARIDTTTPKTASRELRSKIKANTIRWSKGQHKAGASEGAAT